ncbi:MAG: hypothetical protein JW903_09105 [Clostridia bacterium]|nr:hypothetical protein [Clostridia bacterium]
MNIYFGDLHNHCNISYGFGNLEYALMEAREHLDFCTVTGHAHWPDIFRRNEDTGFIIDFHRAGFEKLSKNWNWVTKAIADANEEGSFVTFQSYEMHSSKYGDHHFLSPDDSLTLETGDSPAEVIENLAAEAVAIPHHIAYTPGYRGISWVDFNENISPVVEVYSKHGSGVSDESAGEYLHTMGPRDGRNTVYSGLKQGKRFGFAGSTDHHAGYPGSYGDGLTAVLSDSLDRKSIWQAILARRTYALTGDRIRCRFAVNGKPMGSILEPVENARYRLEVNGTDFIEKAVIYKNLESVMVRHREDFIGEGSLNNIYKIRIEVGWGRKSSPYHWKNMISLTNGEIVSIDKCFRGQNVLAPKEGVDHPDDVNRLGNKACILNCSKAVFECTTFRNTTTRHSSTNAVILEIKGDESTGLTIDVNDKIVNVSIGELVKNSVSGHMNEYNCEAYLIHKAVAREFYNFAMEGEIKVEPGDFIHAEVHQTNGQSAWISPVFFDRK